MEGATMVDTFEIMARKSPNSTAVSFLGRALTYAELDRRSNRIANWLRDRLGIADEGNGMLVPLCFAPGIERIAVILAILKLGAAYVPIDPSFPEARVQHIIEDIGARHVVTDADNAEMLGEAGDNAGRPLAVLDVDREGARIAMQPETIRACSAKPGSACCVMYTPGLSGRQKGVMV